MYIRSMGSTHNGLHLAVLPAEDGALTGQYLAWTTRRPDATCWWCQYSGASFRNCPQWRSQQKTRGLGVGGEGAGREVGGDEGGG